MGVEISDYVIGIAFTDNSHRQDYLKTYQMSCAVLWLVLWPPSFLPNLGLSFLREPKIFDIKSDFATRETIFQDLWATLPFFIDLFTSQHSTAHPTNNSMLWLQSRHLIEIDQPSNEIYHHKMFTAEIRGHTMKETKVIIRFSMKFWTHGLWIRPIFAQDQSRHCTGHLKNMNNLSK